MRVKLNTFPKIVKIVLFDSPVSDLPWKNVGLHVIVLQIYL